MFELLSPYYLAGLAAVGIPLLVHLSRSRKTKKMRFSTTRFFTDQFLRSYHMSKLRERWLLACRIALFALFAFALSQPLLRLGDAAPSPGNSARTVVLVLDNSASMGFMEDEKSLMERARAAARGVVEKLRSGDSASIVLAGRRDSGPEVLFPEPTSELGDVLQAVDHLQVAALGTDLIGAVARAEQIALSARTPSREVYVFSDLQDAGWEVGRDKGSDSGQVSFFFASVRPKKPIKNAGITAVQLGASRPMVGVPFTIRPLLAIGDPDAQSVTVRLYVDGRPDPAGEQQVERLAGGRWAVPRFHHSFATEGWHSGYVEIVEAPEGAFPLDNRRYFAVEVLDKVNLLAVNGAPSVVPRLDELFFLKLALTVSPEGQKSPVNIDTVSPATLADADLSKYPLVVLANVEQLSEAGVAKLEDFAEGGSSVLFFLGDKVDAVFYNEVLAGSNHRHGGLLPGKLKERQGDPSSPKEIANIAQVRFEHPALSAFQDQRSGSLTGPGIGFRALWRMEVADSALLMKASNGAPLLAEKEFGRGRVLVFTSTCDRDWTNFPIRPAFLPWIYRLVAYLAQEPLGLQAFHETGAVVRLPISSLKGGPLVIKKPDGTTGYGTPETTGDSPVLTFSDTTQPGVYSVLSTDLKEQAGMFAVNLESYETDLTYLDDVLAEQGDAGVPRTKRIEAGFKTLLNRRLVTFIDGTENVGEQVASARGESRLWDVILLIVLALAVFEPWLANRISLMRHGKAPPPIVARVESRPLAEVPT